MHMYAHTCLNVIPYICMYTRTHAHAQVHCGENSPKKLCLRVLSTRISEALHPSSQNILTFWILPYIMHVLRALKTWGKKIGSASIKALFPVLALSTCACATPMERERRGYGTQERWEIWERERERERERAGNALYKHVCCMFQAPCARRVLINWHGDFCGPCVLSALWPILNTNTHISVG